MLRPFTLDGVTVLALDETDARRIVGATRAQYEAPPTQRSPLESVRVQARPVLVSVAL